jgi:WD40 repeat protein
LLNNSLFFGILFNQARGISSELLQTISVINYPVTILLLNNDSQVAIGYHDEVRIRIWDIKTKAEIRHLSGHTADVIKLIKLQENTTIASASNDCTIKIWNYTNGQLVKTIEELREEFVVTFDDLVLLSNGYLVGSNNLNYYSIIVWNVTNATIVESLKGHTAYVTSLVLVKSDLLATGSYDMTIRLWNLTSFSLQKIIKDEHDRIECLLSLQNGQQLASGHGDSIINIWSVEITTSLVSSLEGHTGSVKALIHLNMSHIASASEDKTIKIWNYENGALVKTLMGHSDTVTGLVLLNDGILVSISADRTMRTWNLPSIFKYPNRSNLIPYQDF